MADVQVNELITKITAENAQFKRTINDSIAKSKDFSNSIATTAKLATAGFAAIVAAVTIVGKAVMSSADAIGELYDNTQKLNVTVATFQELAVAANEAGVSTGSFHDLLSKLGVSLGNARLTGGQAATALSALGLSAEGLADLSLDQKFRVISDRLKDLHDTELQAAIANDLFGKSGKDAIGLFNSDIDAAISKVRELGLTLTQSQAEGLDKLSETKDFVGTMWDGFRDNVAAELAPAYQEMYDNIIDFVKQNGGVKEVAKDTANFIVSTMNTMATGIKGAITAFKFIKTVWTDIKGSLLGDAANFIIEDFKALKAKNEEGINLLLQHFLPANSKFRDGGPVFGPSSNVTDKTNYGASASSSAGKSIEALFDPLAAAKRLADVQQIQSTNATTEALLAYKNANTDATASLKLMKDSASRAAEVLDSFKAIENALAAPGKDQANSLIAQATNPANTGSVLADATEFQTIFNRAVRDAQTGENKNEIPEILSQLQEIINTQKSDHLVDSQGTLVTEAGRDTSGLVQALNELKSYLGGRSQKQQQVEVKIKVDAGPDFVTNVITTQTFKEAVDAEFDARMAAAARGDMP
jgi:hypothetical protein